jgi:hypothetical protein
MVEVKGLLKDDKPKPIPAAKPRIPAGRVAR